MPSAAFGWFVRANNRVSVEALGAAGLDSLVEENETTSSRPSRTPLSSLATR